MSFFGFRFRGWMQTIVVGICSLAMILGLNNQSAQASLPEQIVVNGGAPHGVILDRIGQQDVCTQVNNHRDWASCDYHDGSYSVVQDGSRQVGRHYVSAQRQYQNTDTHHGGHRQQTNPQNPPRRTNQAFCLIGLGQDAGGFLCF